MILRKLIPLPVVLSMSLIIGSLYCFPLPTFGSTPSFSTYEYEVTVFDETGQTLIGVHVFTDDAVKANDITDLDGKVKLKDLEYRDEVNFTYVGYQDLRLFFYEIRQLGGIIRLVPEVRDLKEIVVIGRRDDLPENVPYTIQKIDKKDIALTNSQTAADALRDHGNVFVQKSQMGGGSPILRGFEANRVLLVVDGVRMNNAIYREGHLQNSITVDNSILERMEVIYGPGSLMYGSDALGGVVHFRSKDPKLYFGGERGGYLLQTQAYTRFSSANLEKTVHTDINFGKEKWGSFTSFTYTNYGDLKAGSKRPEGYEQFGERRYYAQRVDFDQVFNNQDSSKTFYDVQKGTAYSQIDFLQKVRYQPSEQLYFIANLQYSTTSDVPRYDNLVDTLGSGRELKFAEWYYGPQKRFLASLKTRILKPTHFYDKATIIASFQKLDEDRLKRKFGIARRTYNLEDVYVFTLTGDFDKDLFASERHQLAWGFDANHNNVRSIAGRVNINDERNYRDVLTRYPGDGSQMTSFGGYMNFRWKSQDSIFNFDGGVRYSHVNLSAQFSRDSIIFWPEHYFQGIESSNGDLTWGAGLTANTPSQWQIRLLASSAFRSPNVNDMFNIREKGGFVTIPNPDLQPERSWNGELTISKQFGRVENGSGRLLKLSATGFYTYLKDAIVRRGFNLPDGTNLLVMGEELLETQANVNASTAYVYGYSGNILAQLGDKWKFQSSINFTKGRSESNFILKEEEVVVLDTTMTLPLAHIPPMYGQTGLTFKHNTLTIAAVARYNRAKKIADYAVTDVTLENDGSLELKQKGSSDNIEQAFSHYEIDGDGNRRLVYDGTLAWTTYNLYTSWQFSQKFTLDFAVENILDIHYRPFSSGVSAAGRNFIVTLRGNF